MTSTTRHAPKAEAPKRSLIETVDDGLLTIVHNVYGIFLSSSEHEQSDGLPVLLDEQADDLLAPMRIPGGLAVPRLESVEEGEEGVVLRAMSSRRPGNMASVGQMAMDVEAFHRLFNAGPPQLAHRVVTVLVHPFRFVTGHAVEGQLIGMKVISPDGALRTAVSAYGDSAYCARVEMLPTDEDDDFGRATIVYQLLGGNDIAIEVL